MKRVNFNEPLWGKMLDVNLVECGKEQCLPQKWVEPRAKDLYTIHYVINGSGYIKYNGEKKEVSAGDCFIIRPNMLVEYSPKNDSPWCYSWIVFNGLYAEKIIESIFPDRDKIVYTVGNKDVFEDLFDKLVYSYLKGGKITLETVGYVYLIFYQLAQSVNEKKKENKVNQQSIHVREAIDFINFNYMFNISVTDIANSQHISPTYLSSIFKKELSMSPKQYITKIRMERSKVVLETGEYKVKDVALMVGYTDQLHYSHEFKKIYGVSPRSVLGTKKGNDFGNKRN